MIWWLRAEQTATLTGQLIALAPPLGLDPAMVDQAALAILVRDTLARRGGFLLVFDNLEEPEVLPAFLPRTGGTVLITARQRDWHGRAKTLPLDVMTESEAVHLLTGRVDPETLPPAERAQATALAQELGYLPLALAQAHDYMAATGETFAGYHALLVASRPSVLAEGHAHPDYPATIARTWDVSIRAAEKECPAARALLELLAFFAPDPLPRNVLASAPDALPEPLRDPFSRNRTLAALTRFSLVTAAQGSLTIHRLVQAVTRDGLDAATAKAHAGAAVRLVNAALPSPPQEHTNWPAIGALLPHALVATEAAERLGAGLETAARVLNEITFYHDARAAYAEAEPLHQRALAIREKVLGPEHPDVATSLNNLAELYRATGRTAEAEPLHQRALTIWEKVLGPEHPDVATSLSNLALLYRATGRYAEAEPLYQRSLAIRETVLGPEHPHVAQSLNNLAELYRATGRTAEAEPLHQRSLTIREKVLGPDHPDVATSLNNLALLYQNTGRYAEAEPLHQRSLTIREKALGPEHPYVATSLNNLAGLYQNTGRTAEAEPLYQRALTIWEKVLGPEHSDVANSLINLAALYQNTGRYVEAEPLYRRSLTIWEKVLGPEHPDVAISLNNLAGLYRATGRTVEAEPLLQRAIGILEKSLPPEHPHLLQVRKNYPVLLDRLGRPAEAAALRGQAQALR